MPGTASILIVTDSTANSGNAELEGAAAYARRLGTWRYHTLPEGSRDILPHMDASRFSGVIGHLNDPAVAEHIVRHRIPAVGINTDIDNTRIPTVGHDHHAMGRLAADHLIHLGFRNLAYIGFEVQASLSRFAGFAARAAEQQMAVISPASFTPDGGFPTWYMSLGSPFLQRMLSTLTFPTGLLAFNDEVAIAVCDAAAQLGIRIPQQLAIVGIDNNRVRCEFAQIPLTSIDPDLYRVGYEAAALLDQITQGKPCPREPVLVPPKTLVQRRSTDIRAFDDPRFAEALHYLREHALRGITIKEAMRQLPMARIALERACRKYLGHSPAAEIRRIRAERAAQLLAETDLKAEDIARRCGFEYLSHFSLFFRKQTGLSPKAYRSRYQRVQPL